MPVAWRSVGSVPLPIAFLVRQLRKAAIEDCDDVG